MSERYSTQESESVVSDLMQAAAGPYQDDELLDLTARSIRIIAAAMQDEIEFRAGFVRRSVEMEARAEAAEQQAARLRAAAMLYLEGYELYFTTSGDDVPQKQMAEARRQMRAILEIEDQYPDRAALAASQPAPADEAHEYEGACRNVQHAANGACACTALVNGRLCRLSRINPIHQPDAPRGGQAEGEG